MPPDPGAEDTAPEHRACAALVALLALRDGMMPEVGQVRVSPTQGPSTVVDVRLSGSTADATSPIVAGFVTPLPAQALVRRSPGGYDVVIEGQRYAVQPLPAGLPDPVLRSARSARSARSGRSAGGRTDPVPPLDPQTGAVVVAAPLPGAVRPPLPTIGMAVDAGHRLFVLDSMKMQVDVPAPASGTVLRVMVQPGDTVGTAHALALLIPQTS